MQLSPLQSRLAASVIASCLLLVIYLLLFSPQFALAADLSQLTSNHAPDGWSYEPQDGEEALESLDLRSPMYEPDFSLFDRSITGRVADGVTSLGDNDAQKSNLDPETTMRYVFQVASATKRSTGDSDRSPELRRSVNVSLRTAEDGDATDDLVVNSEHARRQQSSTTLWISANTCDQPDRSSPTQTTMDPPQLTLYVSTADDNTDPGPGKPDEKQDTIVFTEGAVMYNTSLDRDVYFSVSAPSVSDQLFTTTRPYNFEIAASTNGSYHAYDEVSEPNLVWVDSDAASTLLTTRNLTSTPDQVITTTPYVMFAQNKDNVNINGIRNSYCGLSNWAQIRLLDDGASQQISIGLKKGGTNLTTEQFYVTGLNASSQYSGIVAKVPSADTQKRQADASEGGTVVYRAVDFETKPDGACTFVFNLTLCDETQYAVPGNSAIFPNGTALAAFYQNYTQTMYDNFDKSLQQVPCQAGATQRYSLVRDCDDCKTAYKNWLCSVAIPRCEDFSAPDTNYLQMRNINAPFPNGSFVDEEIRGMFGERKAFNMSRNTQIDETVQPGPYKELLPCDDLCYQIIQSCPASLGFGCPLPNAVFSFNTSYAIRDPGNELSCNYPGSAHYPSQANVMAVPWIAMAGLMSAILVLGS
ncbi:Uu.00g090300.m01.CDS01 [Anthostomella pinea]|uniref:Uu.00g090300.m01.CDS01 n=1 Tax=Anthostomella pinea TaxID=933095 RepID=A0AAI8YHV3_9PEZI|nr:Uu.00g090300.m01.CDS01 [Anthostomella pinea]